MSSWQKPRPAAGGQRQPTPQDGPRAAKWCAAERTGSVDSRFSSWRKPRLAGKSQSGLLQYWQGGCGRGASGSSSNGPQALVERHVNLPASVLRRKATLLSRVSVEAKAPSPSAVTALSCSGGSSARAGAWCLLHCCAGHLRAAPTAAPSGSTHWLPHLLPCLHHAAAGVHRPQVTLPGRPVRGALPRLHLAAQLSPECADQAEWPCPASRKFSWGAA